MALSMEEQRILDAMERKLAGDDPRLAAKLSAFGQYRLPGFASSGKARMFAVLVSLVLAALVTLMIYQMRPFPSAPGRQVHPAQRTRVEASPSSQPLTPPASSAAAAGPAR